MSGFVNSMPQRNTYYLGINSNGNLYESSKEPREGFVQHINPMTNQPSGYWREHPGGIQAYLDYINLVTRQNSQGVNVQYFIMRFKDYYSNDDFLIMINLKTQKGGIHRYVKSFVKYYQNIDITRELVFNAFKRGKDDQYAPSNLIFAYPGAGGKNELVPLYYKNGQNGWVEATKSKTFDGREVYDYAQQDAFVFQKLNEYIADFNNKIKGVRETITARIQKEMEETYGKLPPVPEVQRQAPSQTYAPHAAPEAPTQHQAPQYPPQPAPQVAPQYPPQPAPQAAPQPSAPQPQPQMPTPQEVSHSGFVPNDKPNVDLPEYDDDLPF